MPCRVAESGISGVIFRCLDLVEDRIGRFANAEAICCFGADKALDEVRADHGDHIVPKAVDVVQNDGLFVPI